MKDLDQILEGNTDEPKLVEATGGLEGDQPFVPTEEPGVNVVEEQPNAAKPRDDKGRFAPKGDEQGAPPAPPEQSFDPAPVIAERRRRQEAEQRAQALEQQLQQLQAQPAPSVWDDEQGAFNHFGGQVVQTAVQQASLNAKLDMSEMMVRQANSDFEEVKAEFLAMAEQNPALVQQALSDPHPWAKAYQIAKNARTMTELGATDLASLEAKLREQIMAELQAGQPAQQPAPAFPSTISNERNVGQRSGPAYAGPKSLAELLS